MVDDIPDSAKDLYYRDAPAWPLSSNPADISVTEPDAYYLEAGDSLLARDSDAEELRKLRTSWLAGEFGYKDIGYIPIEGTSGDLYELRVRDSIPLEDDRGILLLPFLQR